MELPWYSVQQHSRVAGCFGNQARSRCHRPKGVAPQKARSTSRSEVRANNGSTVTCSSIAGRGSSQLYGAHVLASQKHRRWPLSIAAQCTSKFSSPFAQLSCSMQPKISKITPAAGILCTDGKSGKHTIRRRHACLRSRHSLNAILPSFAEDPTQYWQASDTDTTAKNWPASA